MKRHYWSTEGQYWEWEKTGKVYVYGLSGVSNKDIEKLVNIVNNVVNEFGLPLTVKNGNEHNKKDLTYIEKLFKDCLRDDRYIDFDLLESELDKLRRGKEVLPYGVTILVNDIRYEFKNPLGTREPAIYGRATGEGIIVIRKRYIDDAAKHEFAHMIGLVGHHENCVMSYTRTYEQFCDKCKRKIKEIWDL